MTSTEPEPTADAVPPPATTDASPARWGVGRPNWALLAGGSVLVVAAAWSAATGWTGHRGSHPIGGITVLVAALVGLGLLACAVLWRGPTGAPTWRRWTVRIVSGLAIGLLALVVVYTRPLGADQVAIDALRDGEGVRVDDRPTSIVLRPDAPNTTGLVFYPGAKVDPRAYARILRPIAEAGHPVVIAKQPYNLAVLSIGAAGRWIGDADDDVDRWVVGGHSLGGAMAAGYAADERDELAGLLLFAAFPSGDLSDRELAVTSVWGTRDGLATPDDIAASIPDLPPSTEFVGIEGATHAYFGDYGSQSGDGTPGVDRRTAQSQIVSAALALMVRVDAAG